MAGRARRRSRRAAARRAGGAARRGASSAPSRSWPGNADAPVRRASSRVRGLAASCSSAAKRIAAAARRARRRAARRSSAATALRVLRRGRRRRVALDRHDLRRAPRACGRARRGGGSRSAHAAQRDELGQHGRGEPVGVHQLEAGADGAARRRSPLELAEDPLGRDPLEPGRRAARSPRAVAGSSVRSSSTASRTARSVRSGSSASAAGADHPQPPRVEVGAAAVRVEQLAARERLGHRVDREVARGEVGADVAVAQRDEVDVPGVVGRRRRARRRTRPESWNAAPPVARARCARAASRGSPATARSSRRSRGRAGGRAPRRRRARPRAPANTARASSSGAHAGAPSRWCSRGTRGPIPHVIS